MPLAQISLRRGKPPAYRQAILDGLQRALRATFGVPEGDQFMTMTEFDEAHLAFGARVHWTTTAPARSDWLRFTSSLITSPISRGNSPGRSRSKSMRGAMFRTMMG